MSNQGEYPEDNRVGKHEPHDQHGTGSALSVIATFLGTDQMQIFTQSVQ